ncbi:hypothetical protein KP509_07G044200 [Ceratopteris richardii]|uniref:Pentatricopeptide repeat-containing protein n=1 Tax=Ceratopteris richardii TaxID=49495 RepID=A0A8T2UG98_CERRI|nr:hypothetical protein KP509_07G044200 [Ceratopteris richardii]
MTARKLVSVHLLSTISKATAQNRRQFHATLSNVRLFDPVSDAWIRGDWGFVLLVMRCCRHTRSYGNFATPAHVIRGNQSACPHSDKHIEFRAGYCRSSQVTVQANASGLTVEAAKSTYVDDVLFETEESDNEESFSGEKDSADMDITLYVEQGRSETAISMYEVLNEGNWSSPGIEERLSSVAKILSPDLVIEVVKLLKSANMALTFLKWAKDQDGYQPRAEAFAHVIARFGRERDFNSAWRLLIEMKDLGLPVDFAFSIFIHRLKRARRTEGLRKAICGMKFLGVRPSVPLYTSALEFLLKVGAKEHVTQLYRQMLEDGLVPDKKLFEILIIGFTKFGALEDALVFFNDMKKREYLPHASVYSTLISSFSVARRFEEGHELHEEMIATGCALPKMFSIDEIACAVHGNDITNMVDKFLKLVERAPYKWKIRSHNNLLQYLLDSKMVDEAKEIFKRIPCDQEARPNNHRKDFVNRYWNLHSYQIYIIGMCKLRQLDHAMDIFKELLNRRLKPTDEISSFILLSLSEAKRIEEALSFCEYMTSAKEQITVNAQCSFFAALRTSGNLTMALKIFKSMKRKKCIDQEVDFVSVIGLEANNEMS